MKLTLEDKINIYFGRYRTGNSFTAKQYLKVMSEARQSGSLRFKIEEIRKMYPR